MHWANDSFEISESFVYKDITENATLPDDYIAQGQKLAEEQIVKGGYRLAATLKSLNLNNWTAQPKIEKAWYSLLW